MTLSTDLFPWIWTHRPFMCGSCATFEYIPWSSQWVTEWTRHAGWTGRWMDNFVVWRVKKFFLLYFHQTSKYIFIKLKPQFSFPQERPYLFKKIGLTMTKISNTNGDFRPFRPILDKYFSSRPQCYQKEYVQQSIFHSVLWWESAKVKCLTHWPLGDLN